MKCKDCNTIVKQHYDHYEKQLKKLEKELIEDRFSSDKEVIKNAKMTVNGCLIALYELIKIK